MNRHLEPIVMRCAPLVHQPIGNGEANLSFVGFWIVKCVCGQKGKKKCAAGGSNWLRTVWLCPHYNNQLAVTLGIEPDELFSPTKRADNSCHDLGLIWRPADCARQIFLPEWFHFYLLVLRVECSMHCKTTYSARTIMRS